jgi:7-cyano-7-deazaguanine synthase
MTTNKLVTLVSGGLDSMLMSVLAREQDFALLPLFIDYGQLARTREWSACLSNHNKHKLPKPVKLDLAGFGKLFKSGLTDRSLRVKEDAFLPGRNSLFLLAAGSYAYQNQCQNIAIGLLSEEYALFPDQRKDYISLAQEFLRKELAFEIMILTPLIDFNKAEVLKLARSKKIYRTYSCHKGGEKPCGKCISCEEMKKAIATIGGK